MKKKMTNKDKTFWAIIIPVLILFFAFNTLPMIKGFIYSFTNYKGYGTYEYVGFRNYIDLFTDARVGKSYLFTFKYAIVGTILVNFLSLVLALGLNSKIRFKSALRGIYFVPNILGGLVIGYIFSFIFTYILPGIGTSLHIGWLQNSILASEKNAWIGVLVVGVWQAVAMNTIIYISGLQTVPQEVYEASMLDGASKWKEFFSVTLPLVIPFVTINLVLSTKNLLMVFDQIMSLTKGGPAQSTESISYLIYKNGLEGVLGILPGCPNRRCGRTFDRGLQPGPSGALVRSRAEGAAGGGDDSELFGHLSEDSPGDHGGLYPWG